MEFDSEGNEQKRKLPWKKLGKVSGGSLAFCLAVYFLVTSSFFVRRVVFPQIEESLDAKIKVTELSVSPFRSSRFHEVSVISNDGRFSFSADEFDLTANLYTLSKGEFRVRGIALTNPRLNLRGPDGETGPPPASSASSSGPFHRLSRFIEGLDVGEFSIENGAVSIQREDTENHARTELLVEGISFLAADFSAERKGRIVVSASAEYQAGGDASSSKWAASIEGEHAFDLDRSFFPKTVEGNTRITVSEASGQFEVLRGSAVEFATTIGGANQESNLSVTFSNDGEPIGGARMRGPVSLAEGEANMRIETQGIDREILNLLFAGSGLDFSGSQIGATGNLDISRNGGLAILSASVEGTNLGLISDDGTVGPFHLKTDFQIDANLEEKSVLIRRFTASSEQRGETFLTADLDRPMNLSFGTASPGFREASLHLAWQGLSASDWKPLLGDVLSEGRSSGAVKLTAQNDGKRIAFDGDATLEKFTLRRGNTRMSEADARVELLGTIENYRDLNLEIYRATVIHSGRPLMQSEGSGNFNTASGTVRFRSNSEFDLKEALSVHPLSDVSAETGRINSNLNYFSDGGTSELTGNVVIEKLSGEVLGFQPRDLHAIIDARIERKQSEIVVRNSSIKLREGLKDGGLVNVSGELTVPDFTGKLDLRLVGLKEPTLNLLDQRLLGLGLDYSATEVSGEVFSVRQPDQSVQFRNQLQITRRDGAFSDATRLGVQTSGIWSTNAFQISDGQLTLPRSEKAAKNELKFTASIPLSATGPARTQETALFGDQVDVTEFAKLISSLKGRPENGPVPTASAPEGRNDGDTPSNFVLKLGFRELIYDQLVTGSITNTIWSGDGKIRVPEIQTTLNGSPLRVSATIPDSNSATGFEFNLHGDGLPVKAVAASLLQQTSPLLNGNADVDLSLRGGPAGSIYEKMNGSAQIELSQAKIDATAPVLRAVLLPVSQMLDLPELMLYPLELVALEVDFSNGLATVKKLNANSGLFQAAIEGKFQLSEDVWQSPLDLPVTFSLARNVAEEANLVSEDDDSDGAYVKLKDFLRIGGTLSQPSGRISNVINAAGASARVFGVDPEEIEKIEEPLEVINDILNILGGPKLKLGF